jgi:hypothetical protein
MLGRFASHAQCYSRLSLISINSWNYHARYSSLAPQKNYGAWLEHHGQVEKVLTQPQAFEELEKKLQELQEPDNESNPVLRRDFEKLTRVRKAAFNRLDSWFAVDPKHLAGRKPTFSLDHPFVYKYLKIDKGELSEPFHVQNLVRKFLNQQDGLAKATTVTRLAKDAGTLAMNEIVKYVRDNHRRDILPKLLSMFRKEGIKDNEYTFSCILPKQGVGQLTMPRMGYYLDEYKKHLEKFPDFPESNLSSSNQMLQMLCQRTKADHAYKFYQEYSCAKDEITYTTILRAIGMSPETKSDKSWKDIIETIWDEVKNDKKVRIDGFLATAYVSALRLYSDPDHVQRQLVKYFRVDNLLELEGAEKIDKRLPLHGVGFTALLTSVLRQGDYDKLKNIFEKARIESQIELTYDHYGTYIEAISKSSDAARASKLIDDILESQDYRYSVGAEVDNIFYDRHEKMIPKESRQPGKRYADGKDSPNNRNHDRGRDDRKAHKPKFVIPALSTSYVAPLFDTFINCDQKFLDFNKVYGLNLVARRASYYKRLGNDFLLAMVRYNEYCLSLPPALKRQYLNKWDAKYQAAMKDNCGSILNGMLSWSFDRKSRIVARNISHYLAKAGNAPHECEVFEDIAARLETNALGSMDEIAEWKLKLQNEKYEPKSRNISSPSSARSERESRRERIRKSSRENRRRKHLAVVPPSSVCRSRPPPTGRDSLSLLV